MDSLPSLLISPSSTQIYLIHLSVLGFLMLLEYFQQKTSFSKSWSHTCLNLFLAILNFFIGGLLVTMLFWASDLVTTHQVGIFNWHSLPYWGRLMMGLLVLDFVSGYLSHRLFHRIKLLWRFHLVHHSDTMVDASTGHRHHPFELLFASFFTVLAVLLAGAPYFLIIFYALLSGTMAWIQHSNFIFPARIDSLLSLVLVTPGMHRVHHHQNRPLTDSNFGTLFSIWDRLFGTFRMARAEELKFGIDTHLAPRQHASLEGVLEMPFVRASSPNTFSKNAKAKAKL